MNRDFICEIIENELEQTTKRSLSPFAGECVGVKLMQRLGIGAPAEVRQADRAEAEQAVASGLWIAKTNFDDLDRLRHGNTIGEHNVLVRKIPNAISLFSLRYQFGIASDIPDFYTEGARDVENEMLDIIASGLVSGHQNSYVVNDFILPADTSAIRQAIAWDSEPTLRIHAARLFLNCPAAHGGNILTDADGRLYSIDHERCLLSDGEELRMLFDNIRPFTKPWYALGDVCSLSEQNICDMLSDLPDGITWPLGSLDATRAYFTKRLNYWQRRFFEQSTVCK